MPDAIESPNTRLAVYGTLAPGRSNHNQLSGLQGTWTKGTIRGRLFEVYWGAAFGYPGLILDANAGTVDVQIFDSAELPEHWGRLDAFEGSGYKRILAPVNTPEGEIDCWIYELAKAPSEDPNWS